MHRQLTSFAGALSGEEYQRVMLAHHVGFSSFVRA
jgi:hypothetical protein